MTTATLEQWRLLAAVVDHGGFAQAAEQLQKSQSTVSHGVKQLQQALERQGETGESLGRVLIDMKMVSEGALTSILARQIGLKYADLSNFDVDISACSLVDAEIARRYSLIPVGFNGDRLIVAMADPANVFALDDIRIMTGMQIEPMVATKEDIMAPISRYCHSDTEIDFASDDLKMDGEDASDEAEVDNAPIVKYVNLLISEAVNDRASDVHIEPFESDLIIRYRIDGVLHEQEPPPRRLQGAILQRFKLMANMKLSEKRIPQDGRIQIKVKNREPDLRVSPVPTGHGESLVMRILDKQNLSLGLPELGFLTDDQQFFENLITLPDGVILVTGPTGSGKTTTLYGALTELNRGCLLYTSPSPRDRTRSRMPSSA